MGRALIVDAGAVTVAAGPTLTAVPAGAGSTFTVRNAQFTAPISLIDVWRKAGAVGRVQITSPKIVPVSNGIRINTPTGLADFLLQGPPYQALTPQDILSVNDIGTAAAVDGVAIQSYYTDVPGIAMTLKSYSDIQGQISFVFGWPVAAVAAATAGNQQNTVITTTVDSSTANLWYAVIGYVVDVSVLAVGISGVDTSASFVGGPGDTTPNFTHAYFRDLSLLSGLPCIPMFNAANKANTNIVVVDNAASTAVNVTLILAEMNAGYQP